MQPFRNRCHVRPSLHPIYLWAIAPAPTTLGHVPMAYAIGEAVRTLPSVPLRVPFSLPPPLPPPQHRLPHQQGVGHHNHDPPGLGPCGPVPHHDLLRPRVTGVVHRLDRDAVPPPRQPHDRIERPVHDRIISAPLPTPSPYRRRWSHGRDARTVRALRDEGLTVQRRSFCPTLQSTMMGVYLEKDI